MRSTGEGQNWFELTTEELRVQEAHDWAVRPDCGAVVVFSGTVRDHAEGRTDVVALTYEAFSERVESSFADIAAETRRRWPDTGRIVIWHRTGTLELGESSVVVAVSSAHRDEAFTAARYTIDAVKAAAPIWKKEHWVGGSDWGTGGSDIVAAAAVPDAEPIRGGTTR